MKKGSKFIIFVSILLGLIAFLAIFVRFYSFFKSIWLNLPIFKHKKELNNDIPDKEYSKIGPRSDFSGFADHLDPDYFENLTTEEKFEYIKQSANEMVGKWVRINDPRSLYFGKLGEISKIVYFGTDSQVFKVKIPGYESEVDNTDINRQTIFRDSQVDFMDFDD